MPFRDTALYEAIFDRILEEGARHGFRDLTYSFLMPTDVKASANKNEIMRAVPSWPAR